MDTISRRRKAAPYWMVKGVVDEQGGALGGEQLEEHQGEQAEAQGDGAAGL